MVVLTVNIFIYLCSVFRKERRKATTKEDNANRAIYHILNCKVKRSPLICQTFRKKNQ